MLKGHMKFEDIDQLPAWASWSSGASYLPASFYSLGGFELAITDIGTFASSAVDIPATLVLAFGLALRGLATGRGYDTTSGRHKRLPEWVNASALSDESESRIFNMISRLVWVAEWLDVLFAVKWDAEYNYRQKVAEKATEIDPAE